MTDQKSQASDGDQGAARDSAAVLLDRVADKIGLHAGARAVFGEPVERGGVTVVPVAQMIIGTGAGGGTSADDEGGAGAGGGAITRPLGYIEVTEDGSVFRPIRQPWQDAGLVVAAAFASLLVAKAVRTLIRG